MGRMTEPTAVADAMSDLAKRLGGKVATMPPAEPRPTYQTETPEEKADRLSSVAAERAERWRAKVPAIYADADVEALDDLQHATTVRYWLASGGCHLVLAGPVGTGKSFAAYAVGNQAVGRGIWTQAWNVADLLEALRPGGTDHQAEARARRCGLLILDDMAAKATDWEAEKLTGILDARVRENLPTVVTTNLTSAQIGEAWGQRLMDRLRYRLTALAFTGESRRSPTW
jgi:DNA replication protein DnaC